MLNQILSSKIINVLHATVFQWENNSKYLVV